MGDDVGTTLRMALPGNPGVGYGVTLALNDGGGGIEPWKSLLLYSLVRSLGYRRVAEIGVHKGSTTVWLAQAMAEMGGGKVLAIDILDLGKAKRLLIDAGLEQHVAWFDGLPSVPVLPRVKEEPLDMVFVDGDHTYEGCLADIDAYWPILKPGGLMVFDDVVPWPGCGDVHGAILARFDPARVVWLPTLPHPHREIGVSMALVQKGMPEEAQWSENPRAWEDELGEDE